MDGMTKIALGTGVISIGTILACVPPANPVSAIAGILLTMACLYFLGF